MKRTAILKENHCCGSSSFIVIYYLTEIKVKLWQTLPSKFLYYYLRIDIVGSTAFSSLCYLGNLHNVGTQLLFPKSTPRQAHHQYIFIQHSLEIYLQFLHLHSNNLPSLTTSPFNINNTSNISLPSDILTSTLIDISL